MNIKKYKWLKFWEGFWFVTAYRIGMKRRLGRAVMGRSVTLQLQRLDLLAKAMNLHIFEEGVNLAYKPIMGSEILKRQDEEDAKYQTAKENIRKIIARVMLDQVPNLNTVETNNDTPKS